MILCGTEANSFEAVQTCMSLVSDERLDRTMNYMIVVMANPEGI